MYLLVPKGNLNKKKGQRIKLIRTTLNLGFPMVDDGLGRDATRNALPQDDQKIWCTMGVTFIKNRSTPSLELKC